jgi:hypothetical protein
MVQVKKINASFSAQLLKDLTAAVELIGAREEEKQALLDEFDAEKQRYFLGKISQTALASSVKKTNVELSRLDKQTRELIKRGASLSDKARKLCTNQAPVAYRATLTGISGGDLKKQKKKVSKMASKKSKASKK